MMVIRPYSETDFDTLASRWHETNLASYWYVEEQQRHTLDEAREFFAAHVLRECEVLVAQHDGALLGLIALAPGWIRQLAVFPGHQRQGIGSQLIAKARERSPGGLRLHTFQRNVPARAFYEKHGFRAVAFGMSRAPENCPDVQYCWPAAAADERVSLDRSKLQARTTDFVDRYWADHLGCDLSDLASHELRIIRHGPQLADYHGLFAWFGEGAPVVSIPAERFGLLREFLIALPTAALRSPSTFAASLADLRSAVIGPAFVGYADRGTLVGATGSARMLCEEDRSAVRALQEACAKLDWEYGGSLASEQPTAGVFFEGHLTALAGYEVWGGVIAHIAVITHPDFRGRGFGRSAVACIARHALSAGLVPQYRTLEANLASIRVARALGFVRLASTVAARFG